MSSGIKNTLFSKQLMSMSPLESELVKRNQLPSAEAKILSNPTPKLRTAAYLRVPRTGIFTQPRIRL